MIGDITERHHVMLLRMNTEFVHWLSPLDEAGLFYVLARANYARQIDEAAGVLIGYAYDVDYPDHWNMAWLSMHLRNFFYIDRVIIDRAAQGQGLGRKLYADVEHYAWLACEVNTQPNNPGSHAFHLSQGFETLGAQEFPDKGKAVRYYAKAMN